MAPLPRAFMDFSISDKPLGRVVFELFTDRVSKTAENFRCLCTGEKGLSRSSGLALSYKGSPVHRVIDGFMIQGGDFTKRNGTGGESIYGGMFEDERLEGEGTEVDKAGLLVMANRGPNTNGSQYFCTLAPAPHLTGKHVVFGRVVNGFDHIAAIGKLPTDDRDRPFSPVTVVHCGELELRRPPPAKRSASPPPRKVDSRSISRSPSPPPRRRRSTPLSDDSEDERRRERKARKAERREAKEKRRAEKRGKGKERKETEEELDERLEREENERLEKARLENEEATKRRKAEERSRAEESGGVVYKGRGAMRYLDPETRLTRNVPQNYDGRQTSVYATNRRFRGLPRDQAQGNGSGEGAGVDAARWEKGVDARPVFNREKRSDEMDRYRTKGEEQRRERGADDWRFGNDRPRDDRTRERADRWAAETRRRSNSTSRSRSPPRRRSPSPRGRSASPPPAARMRSASPLRGDRDDDSGSDMVMEDD